ncbi:hypothetical protein WKI45_10805 [Delftia tsuruhatensis]
MNPKGYFFAEDIFGCQIFIHDDRILFRKQRQKVADSIEADFYLSLSQDQKDNFKYLAILAVDSAIFRVLRMTDQGAIDIKFNDSGSIAQLSDGLAGELFGDNGWMKEFSNYPSTTM